VSAWKLAYRSLIFFCILGLFFLPLPENSLWWREAANSGHVIVFLLLSLVISSYLGYQARFATRMQSYAAIILAGMLIGIGVEFIQYHTGREASALDLLVNFLGLISGLCLVEAFRLIGRPKYRRVSFVLVITSLSLIAVCIMPLMLLSVSYIERNKAFPVIADFDSHWTAAFTRFNKVSLVAKDEHEPPDGIRRVRFEPTEYPGISIVEPVSDWTEYDRLVVALYSNNDHMISVTVRIHDVVHNQSHSDRYNISLAVEPGMNMYKILLKDVEQAPLNRAMDMTAIAGLTLFANSLDKPVTLGISNIRLVRP